MTSNRIFDPSPRPSYFGWALMCAILGTLAACGPGGELVAVDVAYRQFGDGKAVHVVSAIHVDSEGAAWQATHAAGISASMVPDDRIALSFCEVVDGGPRGSSFGDFQALDLGGARVEGDGQEFALERQELTQGEGSGFRGEFEVSDLPYTPGQDYIVRAEGSLQAPGFGVRLPAPPAFEVEAVGHVAAGAGTIPIPRNRDLRIRWAPANDDYDLFIVLATSSQGLVCRVPDTGEYTIKRKILSELVPMRGQLVIERFGEYSFDTVAASDGKSRKGRGRYSVQRWYNFDLQ